MSPAERAALAPTAALASAVVVAYLADAAGLPLMPGATLASAALAAAAAAARGAQVRTGGRGAAMTCLPATGAVLAYLVWLGWPALLPLGGGPDLAHHLLLVDFIERQRQLPHGPALAAAMGEMWAYTPGAHLLAVLAGAWTGTDGFRAIYPVVAVSVALKAGFVCLIARRALPDNSAGVPLAVTAVLLMLLPRAYVVGAFAHDSFFAQVVGELFAVAMWWAIVAWSAAPSIPGAATVGLMGAATFLTWPIWIGPPVIVGLFGFLRFSRCSRFSRFSHVLVGLGPVAAVAALHAAGRTGYLAVARTSGAVIVPSLATLGAGLPLFAAAGLVVSLLDARGRAGSAGSTGSTGSPAAGSVPVFLSATLLQAAALYAVAKFTGADTPYMALKMVYLAMYPMAVLGAVAIARGTGSTGSAGSLVTAWAAALAIGAVAVPPLVQAARPVPAVSMNLYDAGRWTRDHVPPACVDYIVPSADTAYWLHLAVLGNPRASARTAEVDRESMRDVIGRWIEGRGRTFAIADLSVVPDEVRQRAEVVRPFGRAAVIRGSGDCR
jgi:hypothetical protein